MNVDMSLNLKHEERGIKTFNAQFALDIHLCYIPLRRVPITFLLLFCFIFSSLDLLLFDTRQSLLRYISHWITGTEPTFRGK